MEPSARALDLLSGPAGVVLRAALAPTERLTHAIPAVGCTVALTTSRLLIIREGSTFRPKTGVREWPLLPSLEIVPGPVRHGSGSLAIRLGRDTTSVFVPIQEWDATLQLIGVLRARIRRAEADRRPEKG